MALAPHPFHVCLATCNAGLQFAAPSSSFSRDVWTGAGFRCRSTTLVVGSLPSRRPFVKKMRGGLAAAGAESTVTAESLEAEKSSEKELVSKLLALVERTDRGALLGEEAQANVAKVVGQLEELSIPEPLQSPLIFGDWDVSYSSNPTSPGGGYRSSLGRIVFKTKEMIQTISAPDVVVNIVRFALFGFIDGEVTLRGKLQPLDSRMVQVDFEPPFLQVGAFKFQYGKESSVKLAIIYLDETVRLGRGSRGTVFVFARRKN